MAVVLPSNMALNVKRLANLTRTNIRLRPQSNDTVQSGQTVVFRLPTNTMIDLHNLQFVARCKVSNTNDALIGMPSDMHGAIERIDVVANGQTINGSNPDYGGYHHLCKQWLTDSNRPKVADWIESGDNKTNINGTTDGSAPTFKDMRTALKDGADGLTTSTNGSSDTFPNSWPFVMSGFKGFLAGDHVRFIDTAVLGPVEVRLRLAPNSIMYKGQEGTDSYAREVTSYGGTLAADFEFNNMFMFMDTISFRDDFYRAILARRLIEGGMITIPYTNIFGYNKALAASSDTITFNLATQSMDRLWACMRRIGYSARNEKKYSNGAKNTNYYKFESADNTENHFDGTTTYQFQVENLHMPAFPASVDEAYVLTRAALDLPNSKSGYGKVPRFDEYRRGKFAFVQAFNHQSGGERIISGLDTRGASSNMSFDIFNSDAGGTDEKKYQVMLFVETTSTLEISAGQNITTIF